MLLLLRRKSKVTIYFSVKDSLKFLYNFVLWNVFDLKKTESEWVQPQTHEEKHIKWFWGSSLLKI